MLSSPPLADEEGHHVFRIQDSPTSLIRSVGDAPARDAIREQEPRTRHSRSLEPDPAENADVREHSPNHDLSQASFCVSRRQKFFPCIGALQLIGLQRPTLRAAFRGRRFLRRQWIIIILLAASGTARCQAWCQGCSCPKSRRPRFVLACVVNVLGCATCLDTRQFHADTVTSGYRSLHSGLRRL